ncbi:hypothetical protein SAPIO_CDS5735 [Scedosporium apiospermum]|uniref:Uncharacterized protein n=1 Tax=Pseudallescheria apiosperma TaxID=563466 RepID=A0A084G5A5_PSEDA|nr:uncharacterized protein SAPIO_CDS5735 [Scedosporium apiospermum]KEZ42517.1 hypothetical protein SAPIO_CDS5735 [Scedosporium apiospermum]
MAAPVETTIQAQAGAPAPPAAAPAPGAAKPGPIDNRDVEDWKNRLNDFLAKPAEVINSKSPEGSKSWFAGLFDCFNPIDSCLITCCLPCVTFGKTHHRMRKNANLEGYEPINTTCLLLVGSSCVGLSLIPLAMQRADVRAKYHLEGNCISDILISCCCGCCSLIQQDKEAAHQEALLAEGGVKEQYQTQQGMAYPGQ